MALRDQPYLPLYVQDFMSDEKLCECSAECTGVYIRLMCLMHKSEEYGTVLLKQKDKQNESDTLNFANKLAKHMPYSAAVIERGLIELIENDIIQLNCDKISQKRMVKDNSISLKRSKAGKKGVSAKANAQASAEAKHQANSENENEYEIDNESKGDIDKKEESEGKEKREGGKKPVPKPDIFEGRNFSLNMKAAIHEWLKYKSERRESYKPTGLKNFLSEIENKLKIYSETDIIKLMKECMGNNWKGVAWDKLKGKELNAGSPDKPKITPGTYSREV